MDLTPLSPVSPSPLSPPTTSTTTTQPHPQQQQPDSVTIKVVVPSSNVCKTVRLPVKIKVKELHDILTKKLSTVSNAPLHIYEDYGFYWHSDSGPVWLSDSATLRAYNFKPNVSIEFKKRSASPVVGKPGTPKSKGKKEKIPSEASTTTTTTSQQKPEAPTAQQGGPGELPRVTAVRKMTAWVSSRPGSLYDQKKEKEKVDGKMKKERSQSVVLPRKDFETVVNASRFTSPSFSPTFEPSSSTSPPSSPRFGDPYEMSPRLGDPPSPLPSPRPSNPASLNDLDDLIDIFDDLTDEPFNSEEFSEERMLEAYAANIEYEDLLEESETNLSDSEPLSPRFTYSNLSPSDTPPLAAQTRPRSYSSPHGSTLNLSSRAVQSTPATPESQSDSSSAAADEEARKMPGLRGASTKRDVNAMNTSVRLGVVTSILEDALDGIEAGSADMALMKNYVTSALGILRTLT